MAGRESSWLTSATSVLGENGFVQLVQGNQLLLIHKFELRGDLSTWQGRSEKANLVDKQEEVPVAGVHVRWTDRLDTRHKGVPGSNVRSIPKAQIWSK